MSNLNISTAMAQAVESVLGNTSLTDFTIDMTITNQNNQSYTYSPKWLDKVSIKQDFANDIADKVMLEFHMSPSDYINLFNNSQSLIVNLRFVYINPQTLQRVFTPVPITRIYQALLVDPQDILKKYTTGALLPTKDMPLAEQHISSAIPTKLWLIETDVYSLRQRQFHGIFNKNTVGDVIAYITSQFSIKQLYIAAPDNTMAWEHITIPPSQNFNEVFDFIQYFYGVYMKGIEWYYTAGILFIYPPYEHNPKIKYNADIYNAPNGNYAGILSYYSQNTATNGISIISTTPVKTTDISRPSAEDIGNSFSFLRASSLIDNFVTTNAQGTYVNNNNALTVGTVTDRMTSANAVNTKYTKTTDNIFLESSKLAKWDAVLLECGWKKAVPFLLYPGHNVKYHFDKNGVFTYQQGILEGVMYEFTRSQNLNTGYTYSGAAHLKIRANSDVT